MALYLLRTANAEKNLHATLDLLFFFSNPFQKNRMDNITRVVTKVSVKILPLIISFNGTNASKTEE